MQKKLLPQGKTPSGQQFFAKSRQKNAKFYVDIGKSVV